VSSVSGADGRFQIDGAAAGQYQVRASAAGHVLAAPLDVTVEATRLTGPIEVPLAAGARVRGVVRDERGHPVAAATVRLVAQDLPLSSRVQSRSFTALTQQDGGFELHGVRLGGRYLVEVRDHDVRAPASLAISARELTGVAIQIAARASISGRRGPGRAPRSPAAYASPTARPPTAPGSTAASRTRPPRRTAASSCAGSPPAR
jgi:hypothetical protein